MAQSLTEFGEDEIDLAEWFDNWSLVGDLPKYKSAIRDKVWKALEDGRSGIMPET